jgi:hypothetical protein
VADWVRAAISHGLQGLLALRLENAPAADTIAKTADIWEQAIGPRVSIEQLDAPRIASGFKRIFSLVRKWPAPIQVIELMPPRPRPPQLTHTISAAESAKNVERIHEICRSVLAPKPKNSTEVARESRSRLHEQRLLAITEGD